MYTLQHWGLAKFIFGPGGINLSFAAVRREQVYSSSFPFAARIQFWSAYLTSPHQTSHLLATALPCQACPDSEMGIMEDTVNLLH